MSTALGVLATILLLFVGVWVFVFGGVGALLAPRRGRTRMNGFFWGALLGPIGWAVILVKPGSARRAVDSLPERVPNGQPARETAVSDSDVGFF